MGAQSDPVTHLVNISTIIMNSVKCVAAALMLASSVVNGARVRRDDGYGAPQEDTYGAPAESYGAPVESYGASAPSYGAAAETGLDLTTIIIPLLALLGLFLLFPTYVTLTSVRRKREAIEDAGETNMVERMMDMYQAIIESEECLERVACDVGGLANDAGFDPTMAQLASVMVPNKYSKYMKQFASAKNCHKLKCGNLF